MKFTGTNILYTPQVSQATYLFKNILVDSTGTYRVGTSHAVLGVPTQITGSSSGWLFHLQGGRIFDPSGKFISTYNTGEPFSVSGWVDFSSAYRYLQVGQIISRSPESVATSGMLRGLTIYCPTGLSSGSLSCDIRWLSTRIVSSGSLNNYYIHSQMTGYIFSSLGQYVNSGDFQFYNSYETLLTGRPLLAFVNTYNFPATPVKVVYDDNDSSSQNNSLTFDFQYGTTYGAEIKEYKIQRTGLYTTGQTQLYDLNTDTGFSGLFGGMWSGNRLVYQDQPNTLFLEYYLALTDSRGNPFSTTGTFNVSIPSTGSVLTGEYISGFQLTTGGEYLNPPLIAITGYYYCTGIQQSIGSLLFSSGCTGDLSVTFSPTNNQGTGASGTLQTQATTFSGLYFAGTKVFRTVYNYLTNTVGTGYTMAPRAIVNTGQYGTQCFDIPLASGYNQAWYAPFNTSGTINVEAGWFTGVALVTTGLVSGGVLTGYIVTGIDVYNIGTGYSNKRPPLMSFIRTGENGLTRNASGIFFTNTGSLNTTAKWSVEAGVPGLSPMFSGGFSGAIPLINNNIMYLKIVTTGLDITVPITGSVSVSLSNVSPPITVVTPFVYSKYFDTGTYALKKKYNAAIAFSINDDLSFLLTQDELDTLYSSAGYVDNTSWPWDIGDFDF